MVTLVGMGRFPYAPYSVSRGLRGEDIMGINTYLVLPLVALGMQGGRILIPGGI